MWTFRSAAYAVLTLPLAASLGTAAPAAPASDQQPRARIRFEAMDLNNDNVISRNEWRGSARSFAVHDWNGDGVLSGDEVEIGARRAGRFDDQDFDPPTAARIRYWDETAFANLDHNGDGRLNRSEWHYDAASFHRADRNMDGLLSRAEFLDTTVDDEREDQFDYLDLNGSGRLERNEWHASPESFNRLDRNRDRVLSRAEVEGTPAGTNTSTDQFASIDYNGDGRIGANEWHWSRRSFDERDSNRDGYLTRRELYSAAGGAVGTSGQIVRVDAASQWTDTGLFVRAGDHITISADGKIQMRTTDPNDTSTPGGSPTGRRAANAPLPGEPAGVLLVRVGSSAPIVAGSSRTFTAPASGRLYLGVNDDHMADNSGEYRVTINIREQ
jgi:Ca2+-binding EF-hand superfamily protein